jgi:hypothetical protein
MDLAHRDGFVEEPLMCVVCRDSPEDLDRDLRLDALLLREIDRTHPAFPKRGDDLEVTDGLTDHGATILTDTGGTSRARLIW